MCRLRARVQLKTLSNLLKMGKYSDFQLSFFRIEVAWRDFTLSQNWWKILRVYMVLGDALSKLETFVWILNNISRFITWSLFTLKASYLFKWPISTWSFMWWCQIIDWLQFETRPRSLLNFGMAWRPHNTLKNGGYRGRLISIPSPIFLPILISFSRVSANWTGIK